MVFGEQVASPGGLAWLDTVRADLEDAHYAFGAFDLCAAGVGAPHIRQRLWFVAESGCQRRERLGLRLRERGPRAPESEAGRRGEARDGLGHADWIPCSDGRYRPVEPGTFPLVDGTPERVGRLRGYGNAIVAPLAAEVIRSYMEI